MRCPRCKGETFLLVAPIYRLHARWWWPFRPVKQLAGYLARCTRHGCGRDWEVTREGVDEPSDQSVPRRAGLPPPLAVVPKPEREDEMPRHAMADAVPRPEV